MGTETKFNWYTENISSERFKAVKCSSGDKPSLNCNVSTIDVSQKPAVPYVPIHVDENNVIDGAKDILRVIRPQWDINAVEFKKFTDGITNKLVGCFYTKAKNTTTASSGNKSNGSSIHYSEPSNGTCRSHEDNDDSGNLSDETDFESTMSPSVSESEVDKTDKNVVLVRVYGNKTDLLIDRNAETRNIILLHSFGFAPSLYATFKNGLAYDFVPGVTLNTSNVLRPEVWRLVARRMAEMHRVVHCPAVSGETPVPMLWKKTQAFLDLVPERFSDSDKHNRLASTFLPISRLRVEFERLYRHLESLGSPLVFAHNDLLLGNVVYTESQQHVSFIDYEYADFNFQAFDIGNHFAEFAGVEEVDYARYPKREFQYQWLRVYLQSYLQRTQITDAEVNRLYVQVNQFALAAHFFWSIWCLIQAENSTIDFDYVDYAFVRFNEYLAKKDVFLALGTDDSS